MFLISLFFMYKKFEQKGKTTIGYTEYTIDLFYKKKCTFLWILKGFFYSFIFVINYFELKLAQSAKNSRF